MAELDSNVVGLIMKDGTYMQNLARDSGMSLPIVDIAIEKIREAIGSAGSHEIQHDVNIYNI
jgi:hypothetical protein